MRCDIRLRSRLLGQRNAGRRVADGLRYSGVRRHLCDARRSTAAGHRGRGLPGDLVLLRLGSAKAPVTGPAGMVFVPVAPSRVVDTRVSVGGAGPVVAGVSGMRVFSVASTQAGGVSVVPAGASAIVYNVTVPSPVSSGHLRVMPGDAAVVSSASAINFRAGETIANGLTVKVDAQRRIKVYASVSTDVIVDVVGYFVPASTPGVSGGRFTAVTPTRVYDSAADSAGLLGAHESRVVSVASTQDGVTPVVPAGAGAVAYNITVVRPGAGGHLRVMPGDVASSSASTVNWTVAGTRLRMV